MILNSRLLAMDNGATIRRAQDKASTTWIADANPLGQPLIEQVNR